MNKRLVTTFVPLTFLLITSCASHHSTANTSWPEPPLCLHLFTPTLYLEHTNEPPKCVATARVGLSKEFSLPAGGLLGVVESRGAGKYHVKVQGLCEGTLNVFEGDMELEKPVRATGMLGSGYFIWGCFVLSTNSDCKPFLDRQAVVDAEVAAGNLNGRSAERATRQ